MSYKYTVLADNPILYYRSNELYVNTVTSYQDVIDTYGTYQAFLNAFPNYKSAGTSLIQDSSPCNNDGGYTGILDPSRLPLVPGESFAMKIDLDNSILVFTDYDYNQASAAGALGTYTSSDNDFTLEAWFYPSFTTSNKTSIIADKNSNVGLFYENGNITFCVSSQEIIYTLPYLNKAYHIVAIYQKDSISLYLNSELVIKKDLTEFAFSNLTLQMSSGPTLDSEDYFLINAIAAYRYSLSATQILNHYNAAKTLIPIQVATPEFGELFEFYDNAVSTQFAYSYPGNKSWEYFITSDIYYDVQKNYIQIIKGSGNPKTVILEDFVKVPSALAIDSSRIEWDGDNGITVEIGTDGVTYQSCINGQAIPGYSLDSNPFDNTRNIFIRITMSTEDDSKFLPILSTLSMSFYNNQIMYAQNSTSYTSTLEGESGPTKFEIDLSNNLYPILSRDSRNGLRCIEGSGFNIITTNLIQTIEFFYTPENISNSGLIYSSNGSGYYASHYSWNSGTVSKSNISAIYVNGTNQINETNPSNIFKVGELHHVIIVFTTPISDKLTFNYSSNGSVRSLYQNIALYESIFDSTMATTHYYLYMGRDAVILNDSSFTITENSVTPYNNDWLVYQTV
jgi:Concanavalin A-like lectin/glucanases superfamily